MFLNEEHFSSSAAMLTKTFILPGDLAPLLERTAGRCGGLMLHDSIQDANINRQQMNFNRKPFKPSVHLNRIGNREIIIAKLCRRRQVL